ncbi:DUF6434 domain-containing protein [Flagellimonas sp. S174]|uniref:DUF6434 domain-containing protein n=1 Tax=Flagellimonas sp. S174 TaxID=3410790 RepID=UPI003BF4635F
MKIEQRPLFEAIKSGTEFKRWYWLKEELVDICRRSNLPCTGGKFELQDRIAYALDNDGKVRKKVSSKKKSTFNWAKGRLTPATVITDSVTFGKNFRGFMKNHIGGKFSCHSDFMNWVRENPGKTLQDAIKQWQLLEDRKKDPDFKRKIADHNMYAQYTRDFLEGNPGKTIKDAKKYWLLKRRLPIETGFVRYEQSDFNLKE